MPRRPSRAPAAGASDHAAEVAELRRRALGGDLDDASALRLFLSHAGSPAALPAMGDDGHPCPPNCKGGARRRDCVCGLVPPVGAWRRSGLWQKDLDALVRRAVGDDPRTLARRPRTKPAGLKNLGSTCYVNAALQCLFALPSFRASVFAMKPERDEENEADAGEEDEDPPRAKGGEGRRGLPRDESGGTRGAADDDDFDGVGGVGGSKTTTKTPTPRPASREGPVASLRRLFASLLSGDRAVADPSRFADSLALESGTQQDGAEFLKLLLAYLERRDLAADKATREKKKKGAPGEAASGPGEAASADARDEEDPRPKDQDPPAGFVASHFGGSQAYVTTCDRCGASSEASRRAVDFREIELNVSSDPYGLQQESSAVLGGGVGGEGGEGGRGVRDGGVGAVKKIGEGSKGGKGLSLRSALDSFLATERLDGENRYACERCAEKTDATRRVAIRALPRFACFALKRFVFDLEAGGRRKLTEMFEFPAEIDLGGDAEPGASEEEGSSGEREEETNDDSKARRRSASSRHAWYDLEHIMVHRGQCATSGHYVALVRQREESASDERAASARGDRWWRFDDEDVDELEGGPFGEVVAEGGAEGGSSGKKKASSSSGVKKSASTSRRDGITLAAEEGDLVSGSGVSSRKKKSDEKSGRAVASSRRFASSDAYLLTYRRRSASCARASEPFEPSAERFGRTLPPDLAEATALENAALAAMISTHVDRARDERARLEGRRAAARLVADLARVVGAKAPAAGSTGRSTSSAEDTGDGFAPRGFRFVPRGWLRAFCDDPADPARSLREACASLLCPHGLGLDPAKAAEAVRVSDAAWRVMDEATTDPPKKIDDGFGSSSSREAPAVTPSYRNTETTSPDAAASKFARPCRDCLRAAAARAEASDADVRAREAARSRLATAAAAAAPFLSETGARDSGAGESGDEGNASPPSPPSYLVSKAWLRRWRAWKSTSAPPATLRVAPTAAIACEHGGLRPDADAEAVDRTTWALLLRTTRPSRGNDPDPNADAAKGGGGGGGGGGAASPAVIEIDAEERAPPGPGVVEDLTEDLTEDPAARVGGEEEASRIDALELRAGRGACATCAAALAEAERVARARRETAELHEAALGAFVARPAAIIAPESVEGSFGAEARYRVVPAAWTAAYRAFCRAAKTPPGSKTSKTSKTSGKPSGGKGNTRVSPDPPSVDALRAAVAALACPHGGVAIATPEFKRASRKSWRQVVADADAKDASFGSSARGALAPRPSIAATELVPAEVFETLEDLLGGAVDRAPACAIAFDDEKGLLEEAAAEATSSDVLKPRVTSLAVCAACANEARAWDAANATRAATAYLGATIEVRRIREPPREEELRRKPPKASEGEARPETSFFDGEEKNKNAPPSENDAASLAAATPRDRKRRRVAPSPWWASAAVPSRKAGDSSEGGGKTTTLVGGYGSAANAIGRVVKLTVDHSYTLWRVKLLLLEKLHAHPLDQRVFLERDGTARGGVTPPGECFLEELVDVHRELADLGVGPGARLLVHAGDAHDPDDLTGLEMPRGPAFEWEDQCGAATDGAGVGGRGVKRPAGGLERGFAGTGLTGQDAA